MDGGIEDNGNTTITEQIPAYLRDINELVSRVGVKTSVETFAVTPGCPAQFRLVWTGRVSALKKAGLITPCWRPPVCGRFVYPASARGGGPLWPIIDATIKTSGRQFCIETMGAQPIVAERCGNVEILRYEDATIYYGSCGDLIKLGICEKSHFPVKQTIKRSRSWFDLDCEPLRGWFTVRAPGGQFLFRTESDRAMVNRIKERLEFVEQFYCSAYPTSKGRAEIAKARERLRLANEILLAHGNPRFKGFMAKVMRSPIPGLE